jgi:hypothetical protein
MIERLDRKPDKETQGQKQVCGNAKMYEFPILEPLDSQTIVARDIANLIFDFVSNH